MHDHNEEVTEINSIEHFGQSIQEQQTEETGPDEVVNQDILAACLEFC